jgi:hypothetical protein
MNSQVPGCIGLESAREGSAVKSPTIIRTMVRMDEL